MNPFSLYRYKHPDGTSKDWLIQESNTPPLVLYFDKTGAKKYRSHVIDKDKMADGIELEKQRRVSAKQDEGYVYLGTALLEEGVVKIWPEDRRNNVESLCWTTNNNLIVSQEQFLNTFQLIAEALGDKSVLGFKVTYAEETLTVISPNQANWTIGYGSMNPAIRAKTGQGAGEVFPTFCPVATLILMAINKKIPGALLFADMSGKEVTLAFKSTNPWLMTDIIPLDLQRDIAAKLDLCLRPIDYAQLPSTGLDF